MAVKYDPILGKLREADTGGGGSYTDEQAQDAVGSILTSGARVSFSYDDATPAITADINGAPGSIVTSDVLGLRLDGDDASPGNSKYYGTDGSGTKGFHDLSAGGSGLTFAQAYSITTLGI